MSVYDDPAEVAQERRGKSEAKSDRSLRDLAVQGLLADAAGRRYLWWLLQVGKWGINPFFLDPAATAFACGEQNVGMQVLNHILEVDPTGFMRMQQEEAERVTNRNRAVAESESSADELSEQGGPAAPAQPASG